MTIRNTTPAIMVQGAGSNVGKSLIVAGLCRLFARRGLAVRPFKPQNMSNNAAAASDGGEIGRAQALQARAAGVAPSVHMNPVLLKPESDTGSQIIVQGRRWGTMRAREFGQRKHELLPSVMESFDQLSQAVDLVVVEGAGSPAEVNLRAGDIANMGFAEAADIPVVLVGDIERGGVIANLVGTHAVLAADDRARIRAFMINKFRGDVSLFDEGLAVITERTGWRSLGVLPFFDDARKLPAEDILDLGREMFGAEHKPSSNRIKVIVPVAGRIANFDDLDPLKLEGTVELDLVYPGRSLPMDGDIVLLPGSKTTIADLKVLRSEGWDIDIKAHYRKGGYVVGLCGGYQMLGRVVRDPGGIEGSPASCEGLGLLEIETELTEQKVVRPVNGKHLASNTEVRGYEIHLGQSTGSATESPAFEIEGKPAGAQSGDGRIVGTYVHGVFASDDFRRSFLNCVRDDAASDVGYDATVEAALDGLADHIEQHLDIDVILTVARSG